jgi:hypothetical protein
VTITLGTDRRPLRSRRTNFVAATAVQPRLDPNVEHGAVLVDRAPQVPLCAADRDEHLIEVPFVARPQTATPQLVRVLLPEPLAHQARIVS